MYKLKSLPNITKAKQAIWYSMSQTSSNVLIFSTFDPSAKGSHVTLSNGDLTATHSSSGLDDTTYSTIAHASSLGDKFYIEFTVTTYTGGNDIGIGIDSVNTSTGTYFYANASGYAYYGLTGAKWNNNAAGGYGATYGSGDIIGMAVDMANRNIYFSKNGTWQNSGDPTSGATGTGKAYTFAAGTYYFAVNTQNTAVVTVNTGQSAFTYSIPSGYVGNW